MGFKAGGTVATFVGDASTNERSVYGFHAGLAFHIGAQQGFYVQPELLYSQKGSKDSESFYSLTQHLSYLDLPVAIRYQRASWFLEAGPQVGFLLSADAKNSSGGEKVSVKDAYNTVDAGYLLGVGYQPERGGFGLGARYNGAVTRAPKDVAGVETSLRNSAFQVYATYFFKKTKRHR